MLADGLGSIIGLVDASGGFGNSRTWYEPFGRATTDAANSNPFTFTGREDDRTGLMYFRDRYYSPVLQRFISEDPIGLGGGDVNLHAYVWNDPLNWVDPTGRSGLHNFTQPLDDRKKAGDANKIYEKAIEAVDSVYDKKFEDWSKKQVLDQARKEIPVGAKEEQTALLSDIDKTAKTAVPSFFDKLKSLWTTSSDSLTGRK